MDSKSWWLKKNALIAADATFYNSDAARERGGLTPQHLLPHQQRHPAPAATDMAKEELFGGGRRHMPRELHGVDTTPYGRDTPVGASAHSFDAFTQLRLGNNPRPEIMMPSWSDSPRMPASTGTSTRWRKGDDAAFTLNGKIVPGGRAVVGVNNSVWRTGEDRAITDVLKWSGPNGGVHGGDPNPTEVTLHRRAHRPPVNLSSAWRKSEDLPLTIVPIDHMSPSSRHRVLSARKTSADLAAMRVDNSWRLGANLPIELEHNGKKLPPRGRIEAKPKHDFSTRFSDDVPFKIGEGEIGYRDKTSPRFADKAWRTGGKSGVLLGNPLPYEGLRHPPSLVDETGATLEKKGVRAIRMRRERDILIDRLQELKPLDDVEEMKRVTYLMKGESKFR